MVEEVCDKVIKTGFDVAKKTRKEYSGQSIVASLLRACGI